MGPLGVIPGSFRVDGNFEWVVIERNNEALFGGISNQFGSSAADLALLVVFGLLAMCPRIPPE